MVLVVIVVVQVVGFVSHWAHVCHFLLMEDEYAGRTVVVYSFVVGRRSAHQVSKR